MMMAKWSYGTYQSISSSEKDIGQNHAQACVPRLQELSNAVIISTFTGDLTKEHLSNFQVHSWDHFCLPFFLSNIRLENLCIS
jgi:hypothetical protein